jgi:Zn-dependent metalloprotease
VNGKGVRSMAAPGTAYDDPVLGRDPQPSRMRDYVHTLEDNGGVLINSGILNHAFYRAAFTCCCDGSEICNTVRSNAEHRAGLELRNRPYRWDPTHVQHDRYE